MPRLADRRAGAALVVAVACLLALALLAHGALLLARQELAASRAAENALQARVAAETAVLQGLEALSVEAEPAPGLVAVPLASGRRGGLAFDAFLRVLGREGLLVTGVGRVERGPATATAARLAWRVDPLTRVAAFGATVQVGPSAPIEMDGTVVPDARDWDEVDAPECAPWARDLDAFMGAGVAAETVEPFVSGEPSLGRWGAGELLSALPAVPASVGTPSPAESLGRCVTSDPWGWGDPSPGTPCHDVRVARSTGGSVRLEGGVAQGLLVAGGDVHLSGTRFHGLILAGGTLILSDGAVLAGLARASGGVRLAAGTLLVRGACAALLALESQREVLGRPIPVPAGWIGPLGRRP